MKVSIDKVELEDLVKSSLLLEEMEKWGLDNWVGMEYVEHPTDKDVEIVIDGLTK